MKVAYTSNFLRKTKKLPKDLQIDIIKKIDDFQKNSDDPTLKVHSLHGKFKGSYSFSVNYYHRIVFEYISKSEVVLLDFGDHDVYK